MNVKLVSSTAVLFIVYIHHAVLSSSGRGLLDGFGVYL
jgi:hypothetical protein